MGLLIGTICSSLLVLFGMCLYGKYIVLRFLSKDRAEWWQYPLWFIGILLLCAIWYSVFLLRCFDGPGINESHHWMWCFSFLLAVIYSVGTITSHYSGLRHECHKMYQILKEIHEMNNVKDWTDVKTRILGHIAEYWFWLGAGSLFTLGLLALFGLGITWVGVTVLKYAHTELGAVIIFKDGNISLAGFPLHLVVSGMLGCLGGVASFKILLWRNRTN